MNKKRKETLRRININEHHGRDQITQRKPTQLKEGIFFPKTKTSHRSGSVLRILIIHIILLNNLSKLKTDYHSEMRTKHINFVAWQNN